MQMRPGLATLILLCFVITVSSALAESGTERFTVTSTLDGRTVLPLRIHWIAHPHIALSQVQAVDYSIDGRRAWVEHHPPYYYGNNEGNYGNWLVTSFLAPGLHTFRVRAVTLAGRTATDTVRARVIAAPAPPSNLAGAWTRIVTPDDLKKGEPGPPAGRWTFHVTSIGWGGDGSGAATAGDIPGWSGQDRWDVRYLPNGNVVMGPEINTPNEQNGAFCGVDPLHTWTVALSADDQSMTLNPEGQDSCSDRVAILQGTWTRTH
jgi:hypothetical protein